METTIIKFSKSDFWASLAIGEISAWLIIAVINNLGVKFPYLSFLPVVFPILCVGGLYIAHLIGKKIAIIYQIAKFVLVGGFNTLADWGILAFLIYFFRLYLSHDSKDLLFSVGVFTIAYYSLYKSISFIVAAANSYFWNKLWTFKRESTEGMGKEFGQFFIVTIIGFLLNVFIASAIFKYIAPFDGLTADQWGIVSAVFATIISMVWNFLGYKFIVFDAK
jgi:putative flippase GtrA